KCWIVFLLWAHKKENLENWMVVQKVYAVGTARDWEKHPMWNDSGPVMAPFKVAARGQSRLMGYAAEPDKRAAETWNKYIVTVMYAQACGGKMKPEESGQWAAGEIAKIDT